MKLRINHWASKDNELPVTFGIEEVITQLFIGVIAGIFAFIAYSGLFAMFLFCSFVAVLSLACAIYTTFEYFHHKWALRKQTQAEAQNPK